MRWFLFLGSLLRVMIRGVLWKKLGVCVILLVSCCLSFVRLLCVSLRMVIVSMLFLSWNMGF